jgi:tripartite-type tricarboxylate transporter receptor subunit TctC
VALAVVISTPTSPEEARARIRAEVAKWEKVVKDAGVKATD